MSPDEVPGPEAAEWHRVVDAVQHGLGIYPTQGMAGVTWCGLAPWNASVLADARSVILKVRLHPPDWAQPGEACELVMPPAFARYTAAGLDAHARHIQTRPPERR